MTENMLNDFEELLSDSQDIEKHDGLSDSQLDYIKEALSVKNGDFLVDRIDEMSECHPPKAIDADKEIAALIEPMKEQINPIYLEAPQDYIQIEKISDTMMQIEGVEYSEWKELSFEERMETLQEIENKASEISHRPICQVLSGNLEKNNFGYYSHETNNITIDSNYICSDSYNDYKEVLDTVLHEGRHAYQTYNLYEREVHPRQGEINNWQKNEFVYDYQDPRICGFAAYCLQPLEADARAFAEDILKQYTDKLT